MTSLLLQDHVTVNEDHGTGLEPRLLARDASDQEECAGHSGLTEAQGEAGKGILGGPGSPVSGPVAPAL